MEFTPNKKAKDPPPRNTLRSVVVGECASYFSTDPALSPASWCESGERTCLVLSKPASCCPHLEEAVLPAWPNAQNLYMRRFNVGSLTEGDASYPRADAEYQLLFESNAMKPGEPRGPWLDRPRKPRKKPTQKRIVGPYWGLEPTVDLSLVPEEPERHCSRCRHKKDCGQPEGVTVIRCGSVEVESLKPASNQAEKSPPERRGVSVRQVKCRQCGEMFKRTEHAERYCSDACRKRARRAQERERKRSSGNKGAISSRITQPDSAKLPL